MAVRALLQRTYHDVPNRTAKLILSKESLQLFSDDHNPSSSPTHGVASEPQSDGANNMGKPA
jgi:hypothetical protein